MLRIVSMLWAVTVISACAPQLPIAIIPIEIVEGNAVASARVGADRFDLIVDTGGFGGVAIGPKDLDRIQVEFTGAWVERTDAAGDFFKSREFVIPELSVGDSLFKSVHGFERISSTSGFAGGKPMNVLGRGFLHKFTVVVDYPNERIELYDSGRGSNICGPKLSDLLTNEDGQLVLHIQTDGGDMLALMDTGATYSFLQSKVVASRGLTTIDDFYMTTSLKIGNRDFGPLEMVVLPINGAPEIDVLLGGNFFLSHKVCFDNVNRTMSVLD